MTAVTFQHSHQRIPAFILEPESAMDRMFEFIGFQDIDFDENTGFSDAFCLHGADEAAIRNLFTPEVLSYLEGFRGHGYVLECTGEECICSRQKRVLNPTEMNEMLEFLSGLLAVMQRKAVRA